MQVFPFFGKLNWAFVALKCDKYQFSRFFSHWCKQRNLRRVCALAKIRLSLATNVPIFFSRLTQAAKAQAGLCIGISWRTEPSLLKIAITMHCEIFQIKHWNIDKSIIRTYFLKKGCYWKHTIRTPIQDLHCFPRYKDKDLRPRTQRVKPINYTVLSQLSS